ncbi:MAG: ABC transporter ATP-binding protein [Bradyrhizobiaceae bacterium]|nr:MAG: ABC transporter ATP-binding protein [Bradyrhizobiaceae bacterium]
MRAVTPDSSIHPDEAGRGRIVLHRVTKYFGDAKSEKAVVEDCSFTIEPGKLNVIIGPSGCGKSTLLNLIAGFDRVDAGTITCNGKEVSGPGADRLLVFQESALFDWMTTYDNIAFGPRARGDKPGPLKSKAQKVLERVGLGSFRDKYPPQLSGGMQRRIELARAIINDPAVMLLDEPFRGLDAMTKGLMQEYFLQLYAENPRTAVFVTTDIDEAILLADRLIILSNSPASLRRCIEVDIPKPRTASTLFELDVANDLKREALEILYQEALKSFRNHKKADSDFVQAYSRQTRDTNID